MKAAWMWTAVLAGLLVVGCSSSSDEDSTDGPTGSAPEISDFSLSPDEIEVGKKTTLTGTMSIQDEEGDVEKVSIDLTLPDGTKQAAGTVELQNASGVKEGKVTFSLMLSLPSAGDYEVDLAVLDSKGHESNHLNATVTATK